MAGIFGVIGEQCGEDFEPMAQRLAHRGSKFDEFRVNDEVIFGSLSQPAMNPIYNREAITVVSAGAAYNGKELHSRLKIDSTDHEADSLSIIIDALYRNSGEYNFSDINGDFAFALWDSSRRILILCRDFFGCIPLFYTVLPSGGIAFASEYKSLLAWNQVNVRLDLDMLQNLQNCKRLPLGRTLLKEIKAVLPGAATILNAEKASEPEYSHFPALAVDIIDESEDEHRQAIVELLSGAIECRVGNSKSIGIALSGGIDSMGMACLCRRIFPNREIHTFTAGYGDEDTEIVGAKEIAKYINSIHHEIITPPSLLDRRVHELVWHMEDPYSRSEALQLFELARCARPYVDFLFSAQGADGLFGGMPKYKLLWYMKLFPPLAKPIQDFYSFTQISARPKTALGRVLKYVYFKNSVPDPPRIIGTDFEPSPLKFPSSRFEFINQVTSAGFQTGVCQDILKFERTFAAFGIQYISPFYDLTLVRRAYRIPDQLKIRRGMQKYILRQAFKGLVPDTLLLVPKLPQRMNYDLEFTNKIDSLADDYLSEEKVKSRGIFDSYDLQRIRKRKSDKPYSAEGAMRIWTAILTEIWAIEFLDKKGKGFQ